MEGRIGVEVGVAIKDLAKADSIDISFFEGGFFFFGGGGGGGRVYLINN